MAGEEWDRLRSARVVVGLFLTWRDDRVDDAVDTSLVQQLARVCAAHGGVLAYKAHYNVAATEVPSAGCVPLPADADLHAYLGLCDVLVTDYSSIALDFLLMRRPVVFYTPDLEHYAATRGFEIEPQSLPGVLTRDPQALLDSVDRLLAQETGAADGDDGTVSHDLLLRTLWGGYDGGASEAITAAIAQASSSEVWQPRGHRRRSGHPGEVTSSRTRLKCRRSSHRRERPRRGARRTTSV